MLANLILNRMAEGVDLTPQPRVKGGRQAIHGRTESYDESRERRRRLELSGGYSEHSLNVPSGNNYF